MVFKNTIVRDNKRAIKQVYLDYFLSQMCFNTWQRFGSNEILIKILIEKIIRIIVQKIWEPFFTRESSRGCFRRFKVLITQLAETCAKENLNLLISIGCLSLLNFDF